MVDETIEDLPGFSQPPQQPTADPLDPTVSQLHDPQSQEPNRPRVSGDPESPSSPSSSSGARTGTSSTTFSDVEEALAGYGVSGFFLASVGIDNLTSRRRKTPPTGRWLATEEEAERFGDALGRIAARRVPEELVDKGDTADYLIMGEAILTYAIRAGLGLSADQAAQVAQEYVADQAAQHQAGPAAPPQYYEPPPTAPDRVAQPAPTMVATQGEEIVGGFGAVAATPAPPDTISPEI
jgi:hypothetical protein